MDPKTLFGREEELAVVTDAAGAVRPAPTELAAAVVEEAAAHVRHLPAPPPERRYFLGTGGCLYEDVGHVELATPECSDPIELAAHTLALRELLARAAEAVGRVYGVRVRIVANNVDYAFGGSRTYGHHLNFLTKGLSLAGAAGQIAPLLAAMPVLAGTGKVSFATGAHGFELSQRAAYFTSVLSHRTTSSRGMITAKDEALCGNGVRVHVISVDTAISPWQVILAPAVLALTLKAVEAGQDVASPVALEDPVRALRRVSSDPSLKAGLQRRDGGTVTALDIHEHYHTAVARHVSAVGGPSWAPEMLDLWADVIARLRADAFSECKRLDWAAKLVLFTQVLSRQNLDWQEFSRWKFTLASVRRLKATWPELDPLRLTSSAVGRSHIRRSALGILEGHFAQNGLSWADFPQVWDAANRLCEHCLRYHTLGTGLPPTATCAGSPVTRAMVEQARIEPPKGTRAAVRGKAISAAPAGAQAGWDFVQVGGQRLAMDDAFGEGAAWHQNEPQHQGKA